MKKTTLFLLMLCYANFYAQIVPDCSLNLSTVPIEMVSRQGDSQGSIDNGGFGITISGNGWNALRLPQTIDSTTLLEFEFSSTEQGEEHAIGFARNLRSARSVNGRRFKLYGTQDVDISNAERSFSYLGNGIQSFSIPVGQFFTGDFEYIVFVNDNDENPVSGNSSFRNIRLVNADGTCIGTVGRSSPTINHVVNFATEATSTPTDFIEDVGMAFGPKTNGLTYGWSLLESDIPFDAVELARNRPPEQDADPLRETLIHLNHRGTSPQLKWEIEVPNGMYRVVLQAGDLRPEGIADTAHKIKVEGELIVDFKTGIGDFGTRKGAAEVVVADGRLTVDGSAGLNAKINSVVIQSMDGLRFPAVIGSIPADGATDIDLSTNISANFLSLPNINEAGLSSLDNASIDNTTVQLFKVEGESNTPVAITVNGTGGGDAINISTRDLLEPNTRYRYLIKGVRDLTGATLFPYSAEFITGTDLGDGSDNPVTGNLDDVVFERIGEVADGRYTSLTFGPDGKLYALRITGEIDRWLVNTDGTLANRETLTGLTDAFNSRRLAIGLTFAPNSSATDLVAYVTHSTFVFNDGPEYDGKLSRLSGVDLQEHQTILTGLPRSVRDHLTNSMVFDPQDPNVLYFNQGSNSAGGAADDAWGNRPERLLTAATLRLDLNLLPSDLPLNVRTSDTQDLINNASASSLVLSDGTYNPYATNAPLTIFASGVRNAYDLVWHSNGQLYIPTNGTAGGSNSPASVVGTRRPDGSFYSDVDIPAVSRNSTQRDFLFRVDPNEPVGYYGHPNPFRGEYVLNNGAQSTNRYPSDIVADENYKGFAFDFEFNISPNGIIEYKSPGPLQGALIVCRYSGGSDLIALVPDGPNGDIDSFRIGLPGFTNFDDPLDLVEDPATGNLYVSDLGERQIILLRASDPGASQDNEDSEVLTFTSNELIFEAILNEGEDVETLVLHNEGNNPLVIENFEIIGDDAALFSLDTAVPLTLSGGASVDVPVTFDPGVVADDFSARLMIHLSNGNVQTVGLFALGKNGFAGRGEPTLQQVVNTLGYPINVGGDALNLPTNDTGIGDEILNPIFEQANNALPISLMMVGRYSPIETATFGHYAAGDPTALTELLTVLDTPENSQTLFPDFDGASSFNISGQFGFFGTRSNNETFYTEDRFNINTGVVHAWRIYPAVDRQGVLRPDTYIFALEEATNGDYQDYVYVISNIRPVSQEPDVADDTGISVSFIAPANNDLFIAGESFIVEALATDDNGSIDNLRLFINDALVRRENSLPYTWGEATQPEDFGTLLPGNYNLRVVATDNDGNTAEAEIDITLNEPNLANGVRGTHIFVENLRKIPGTNISFPFDDRIVFHRATRLRNGRANFSENSTVRINNTGTNVLNVSGIAISSTEFEFENQDDANGFELSPGEFKDVVLRFVTDSGEKRVIEATLTVFSDDPTLPISNSTLVGAYMEATGGIFEFWPQELVDIFGFRSQIKADGSLLRSEYPTQESIDSGIQGDLVPARLWEQADPNEPVSAFFLYAFRGRSTSNTGARFIREDGGIIPGFGFNFGNQWHQTLFPRTDNDVEAPISSRVRNVDGQFAIRLVSSSTLGSGLDDNTGLPENLGVRVYRVIESDGTVRENEYFAIFDFGAENGCVESPNPTPQGICDYNDVAVYIRNIKPVSNAIGATALQVDLDLVSPENDDVLIYPNPTSDELFIDVHRFSEDGPVNLKFLDTSGKILYDKDHSPTRGETSLSLGQFQNGRYYLVIEQEGKRATKSVLIRK